MRRTEKSLSPTDRLPQSPEAEVALLGSIFFEPEDAMAEVAALVEPDDFHVPANRVIASVLWSLFNAGRRIDPVLVYDELCAQGQEEVFGGHEGLIAIARSMPEASHASHYAEIVRRKARLRSLISLCEEGTRQAYRDNMESGDPVEDLERRLAALDKAAVDVVALGAAMRDEVRKLDDLLPRERVLTGLADLDHDTGGFWSGEVTMLAARPSMGKTTLALNICRHVAATGCPVLFCSLEMTTSQLARNLIACQGRVDGRAIREGVVDVADYPRVLAAVTQAAGLPFYLAERARSTNQIRALAQQYRQRQGVKLLVIDHLQLVHGPGQTLYQKMTGVSNWTKELAVDLHIAVLALSQLRRAESALKSKEPRLDDLRDSGALEQDADVVLLMHREDYYRPDAEQDNIAQICIAKNRNGPTRGWGDRGIKLVFFREHLRFENAAWDWQNEEADNGRAGEVVVGPVGQGAGRIDGRTAAAGEGREVCKADTGPVFRGQTGATRVCEGSGEAVGERLKPPAEDESSTEPPGNRAVVPQDAELLDDSTPTTSPAPPDDTEPRFEPDPEDVGYIDRRLEEMQREEEQQKEEQECMFTTDQTDSAQRR